MKRLCFATLIYFTLFTASAYAQSEFIKDHGYAGLAFVYKTDKSFWSPMGGWMRYYSQYNFSILLEGGLDTNIESETLDSDPRYQLQRLSNGQTRCRDTQTGQFAKTELCQDSTNYNFDVAPRISGLVNYHFNASDDIDFIVGAGYILSNLSTPILSVGFTPKPKKQGISVALGFGKGYFYLGGAWIF